MFNKKIKILKSGRAFRFNVDFNDVIHFGVYNKNIDLVTVTYYIKHREKFETVYFSLKEAVKLIEIKEWYNIKK